MRSPIDGEVLQRIRRAGEQVTELGDTPILAVGDMSRLRVRAEVDEADIGLLRLGQAAYVQAAAYGERRFPGTVGRIGNLMGRKQVFSDDPSERQDTRVLEVLIDLEPDTRLPAGLRVDALPAATLGFVYLPALAALVVGSMTTARYGARAAHRLPVLTLKRVFACLLYVLAARMVITYW